MIFNLSEGDLNELDFGTHMFLLREWNEETLFVFEPAVMVQMGYHTMIIHEDNHKGVIVATYQSRGEGDLISLRIYTPKSPFGDEYYKTKENPHETRRSSCHNCNPRHSLDSLR